MTARDSQLFTRTFSQVSFVHLSNFRSSPKQLKEFQASLTTSWSALTATRFSPPRQMLQFVPCLPTRLFF